MGQKYPDGEEVLGQGRQTDKILIRKATKLVIGAKARREESEAMELGWGGRD